MNVNIELFRRTAPSKKIEMINNLSADEVLNITEETLARIVKEVGYRIPHTRDYRFYINHDMRVSNNWNSEVEGLSIFKKKIMFMFYVQFNSSDSTDMVLYREVVKHGKFLGTMPFYDYNGCTNTAYYNYNEEDIVKAIKNICLDYIYNKYEDKL